jgi:transporter family-2 protein
MSSTWLYPFIIVAGALQAAGAVMNAQLRCHLFNPWLASFVSFVLIAFFFASMFAILPRRGRSFGSRSVGLALQMK